MKIASVIQYTLPGVPSLYYGDEAGMEGYKDPFNRVCYPWGNENKELLAWYKALGVMRINTDCLKDGLYHTVSETMGCLAYVRSGKKDEIIVIANRNEHEIDYVLPSLWYGAKTVIGNNVTDGKIKIGALEAVILKTEK